MFIVIEGVDGSGKSSLVKALAESFTEMEIKVATTREPGGTPFAEQLRTLLFETPMGVYPETNLLFAARDHHWHNVIKPLQNNGFCVISDRFVTSTWVYQVKEKNLPAICFHNHMEDLYESANVEGLLVQHEFLLDVPYEVAQERMVKRGEVVNRFDSVTRDSFDRRRHAYLDAARNTNDWAEQVHILDATQPMEASITSIMRIILNVNHAVPS